MSAIKAGDLVVVVADGDCICSPHPSPLLGQIFKVSEIGNTGGYCAQCMCATLDELGAKGFQPTGRGLLPLRRLRRIPPLAELRYADRFEEEKV